MPNFDELQFEDIEEYGLDREDFLQILRKVIRSSLGWSLKKEDPIIFTPRKEKK